MTDNDLIRGIRENSTAAWREIYHANYAPMKAKIDPMLRRVKGKTFDDIYSEAMIALMENVKDGKLVEGENTRLSGYIFTLCWRIALRLETKGGKEEDNRERMLDELNPREPGNEGPFFEDDEDDGTVSPEEYEEAMAFLEKVLNSIPPSCRTILRRFYWDKMPMKDIAALMGLKNEDSAKTTKNRCMNKFKEIAKAMLADDTKADAAVRRTIERSALRDLLEEIRQEEAGERDMAALKNKDKKK
jgi:RNA polymerase sigma factor, sigma-70 family